MDRYEAILKAIEAVTKAMVVPYGSGIDVFCSQQLASSLNKLTDELLNERQPIIVTTESFIDDRITYTVKK